MSLLERFLRPDNQYADYWERLRDLGNPEEIEARSIDAAVQFGVHLTTWLTRGDVQRALRENAYYVEADIATLATMKRAFPRAPSQWRVSDRTKSIDGPPMITIEHRQQERATALRWDIQSQWPFHVIVEDASRKAEPVYQEYLFFRGQPLTPDDLVYHQHRPSKHKPSGVWKYEPKTQRLIKDTIQTVPRTIDTYKYVAPYEQFQPTAHVWALISSREFPTDQGENSHHPGNDGLRKMVWAYQQI